MRVLIVDDHPAFRAGLRDVVRRMLPGVEVFEAGDIAGALAQARAAGDLDLVTLDLKVPGAQGLSGLRALRSALPLVPTVVVSMVEVPGAADAVLGAGASGFISKSADEAAIAEALRAVLDGGTPILLPPDSPAARQGALTPRQRQVLGLLRRGLANKEIATQLGISVATVQIHVSAILHALGLENRTQAAMVGLQLPELE